MANISKIAVGGTEYDIAGIGLIATIEETLTASKTYNVGDQFIYQGLLYQVTQTIASGTAITIGSNCQLAPVVADQLTTINSNFIVLNGSASNITMTAGSMTYFTWYHLNITVPTGYTPISVSCALTVSTHEGRVLVTLWDNEVSFWTDIGLSNETLTIKLLCIKSA